MRRFGVILASLMLASTVQATELFYFNSGTGLAAEVEFTLLDPDTFEIRIRNTSTADPGGFDSADQLLTGVSWDFGDPGLASDNSILGGTALIGPSSSSVNFSTGSYGPGTDIGGEWGFGNADGSGALPNFVSGNTAGATAFGGANLDGPAGLNGPQAGLAADPPIVSLGGQGAIIDEIYVTVNLENDIADFGFLKANGVQVEFGSDAAFLIGIPVPEPASMGLLALGAVAIAARRGRKQ